MTALMRPPKREPIVVKVPYPKCEVAECLGLRQYDMVVLFLEQSKLELFQVCGVCAFLWRGFVPANFFPLNKAPSLNWMAHQVEQELIRRNPPRPVYYQTTNMNYGTSTGGNMYFRFG